MTRRKVSALVLPGARPKGARATRARQREAQAWLATMERARVDVIRTYRKALTVPHSLAYEMESVGDESMFGYEEGVLARYRDRLRIGRKHAQAGADATRNEHRAHADVVMAKNADLLGRVARGTLTPHGAAVLIRGDWQRRGDGDKKPLITLRRWVDRSISKKS